MPTGVIGRMGRWCFRHWAWTLAAWALSVVAGVAATGPLFDRLADSGVPRGAESIAAYDMIAEGSASAGTVVAVIDGVDPSDTRLRQTVSVVADRLKAVPGVAEVQLPGPRARSADGRAVLVSVVLGDIDRPGTDAAASAIVDEFHSLQATLPPGASVEVGGGPVLRLQTRVAVQQDLKRAEYASLPITLIVLVVVFGGILAAGLPVLTAAVCVAAAMAMMLGFSTFTDVDQDGMTVVTLLGLGLSIDYGLLLVARYREELLRGRTPESATVYAWSTAGRTIAFSALTVAAALTGLLMFDVLALTALGAAGVSIAVVCMIGSLTFTAAMIGMLGRWIKPTRRQRRRQSQRGTAQDVEAKGFFARLSRVVQRRPGVVALVTAALLLAAGAPLVTASARLPGLDGVPRTIEAARVADALDTRFGRPESPAITVVARTDPHTLDVWAARWSGEAVVRGVRPARAVGDVVGGVSPGGQGAISSVAFDVHGDPQAAPVRDLVARMRADRPSGGQSWVTGDAAVLSDLLGLIGDGLPLALGTTIIAMMVLLFAMTGSVVVPAKAIVANVVSLGATFGVLTAVFGEGFLSGLLDTLTTGALNPFVVVIVFGFAFGLSMDYELFLLGRVKEYVDEGLDTDAAVRRGLQQTGSVITSAALLMVVVFSCFAAARIGNIEQIGLGLAVAVFIDATIVRCLLVPATMTLLGRWNWWAPRWLSRIHARAHRRLPVADVALGPVRARELKSSSTHRSS